MNTMSVINIQFKHSRTCTIVTHLCLFLKCKFILDIYNENKYYLPK